jgi:predicted 3-demethylubiquinone-9 3-methyltransferase (glyoxalase superfamily)
MSKITPCLWFDGDAEEAASFYASLFPDSRVESVMRAPGDTPSGPEGSVLVVQFTLAGQRFTGLNGGPQFAFTPAVSFVIDCEDQDEVDRYWEALSADEAAEQCGWVRDRFGVSWQIIPRALPELLADPDPEAARRVLEAMLEMKKIDVAGLERARAGADR